MTSLTLAEYNRDKAASLLMPNVPADAEADELNEILRLWRCPETKHEALARADEHCRKWRLAK